MPVEHDSYQERGEEFRQYTLDLIDDREKLEHLMRQRATKKSVSLAGYSREGLQLPTFLDLHPLTGNDLTVLDFEVQSVNGAMELQRIEIKPEDTAPIIIRDDHGIMLQESGDNMSPLPASALNDTLFSLFPESVRYKLTVDKAIEVITQLSPESTVVHEFEMNEADFLANVRIANSETVDDSLFSLEVVKTVIHPSGQLLGTRMNLSESIQRQIKKADITSNAVALDINQNHSPVREFSFDSIFGNKIVPVFLPTRRHIEDIDDVLGRLDKNRFDPTDAGAAWFLFKNFENFIAWLN